MKDASTHKHANQFINGRQLVPSTQSLLDQDICYKLGAADYKILEILLENVDQPVSRDTLFEQAWEGKIVSEARLTQSIFNIRFALGDDGRAQKILKTIAKKGYLISSQHIAYQQCMEVNESEQEASLKRHSKNHYLLYLIVIIVVFIVGFMFGSENKPGKKYLDSIYKTSFSQFPSGSGNIAIHLEKNIEPISLIGIKSSFYHFNPGYFLDIYILKNNKRFTYV
ncbi:winged helix-turn-helix domain-containing protein, partial [Vibrio makurazakiensis]|uniref:winged helix-turn-helix domain-containing protein n=1 Tax=Vibrio makurazakiensis TaxID=2910250 RepID=UPI003D09E656